MTFAGRSLLVLALLVASSGSAAGGLCGDTSGDGWLKAADALKTLKLAVASGYDRRGDLVAPFAKLTAGDALATLKAVVQSRVPDCAGGSPSRVFVSTAADEFSGNFGGVAVVDVATRAVTYKPASIYRDAVVRVTSGEGVVVNRFRSNSLQLFDIDDPALPNVKQCSVADNENSNSQDYLRLSPAKGYVTSNQISNLLVVNPGILEDPKLDPACSSIITKRIDLSSFDPDDGIPEMDQMAIVGSELFVSLQLLHFPTPVRNGVVAVIDTATDTVTDSIPLHFVNPFASTKGLPYDEFRKLLYVGGPGVIADPSSEDSLEKTLNDGGIEAIDPATHESSGMLITGADIHADIFDFVVVGSDRAFAVIADGTTVLVDKVPVATNAVVELDLKNRRVLRTLVTSAALITDIEMTDAGELWIAYRGEAQDDPPGLRIFDVSTDPKTHDVEQAVSPIDVGQAPFSLAFVD